MMSDLDCVGLILAAMETHMKSARVVKNACLALAAVVEPDGQFWLINEKSILGQVALDRKPRPGYDTLLLWLIF